MTQGCSNEIHLYDSETGQFIQTYPSQKELERSRGLYRGAITDNLRRKNGLHNKILVSRIKYDVHPKFSGEPPRNTQVVISESIQPTKANTLSEDELRKKHDMFFMIHSFVSNIPEGRFVEEPVMLRQLGLLGKPRYREALSRAELKDYRGKVDGVIYYGSAISIRKLKQEGVLQ
jgi:hypothetical protein